MIQPEEHTRDAQGVATVANGLTVAVVIPAFNERRNLARLVQQVLAEPWDASLTLDRIVIVDDCSDDGTAEIAETLARQHQVVQVIRHGRRSGKNAGIRDGLAACQSDAIAILDADVYMVPRCLTQTAELLRVDPSLAASSCMSEPLPAQSWYERASRFQALFVAELGRLGHGSLLRVYCLRATAIEGLALPDTTHDDLYIPRWLRRRGCRYAMCHKAVVRVRSSTGLHDFAKQTLRSRHAAKALQQALPDDAAPPTTRPVTARALLRAAVREPLGVLLYVIWLGITLTTPTRWWLPVLDYSRHDQSLSTKDVIV
jgi:glycosyltransferase involved in cell wall biosynthesis